MLSVKELKERMQPIQDAKIEEIETRIDNELIIAAAGNEAELRITEGNLHRYDLGAYNWSLITKVAEEYSKKGFCVSFNTAGSKMSPIVEVVFDIKTSLAWLEKLEESEA